MDIVRLNNDTLAIYDAETGECFSEYNEKTNEVGLNFNFAAGRGTDAAMRISSTMNSKLGNISRYSGNTIYVNEVASGCRVSQYMIGQVSNPNSEIRKKMPNMPSRISSMINEFFSYVYADVMSKSSGWRVLYGKS